MAQRKSLAQAFGNMQSMRARLFRPATRVKGGRSRQLKHICRGHLLHRFETIQFELEGMATRSTLPCPALSDISLTQI